MCCDFGFRARHNEDVGVIRRTIVDVRNFLVHVPFYSPASWRVEMSQVADFHGLVMPK